MTKTTKAVAYYRMSSDKQETSIADQRAAVETYAKQNGYKILREYIDEGISGDRTDKRKAFQQMRAEAANGDFKTILCWDQDRFGRFDIIEAGKWIQPLREAGVSLATVAQGPIDWEDLVGQLIYSVNQLGKAQYLRDLSRNVQRGMGQHAAAGKWTSGQAPMGYKIGDNGRLEIDTELAPLVRRIYRMYLDGHSLRGITQELNTEGLKSRTGKKWNQQAIRYMLTNEAYYGAYIWNKRAESKYGSLRSGIAGSPPIKRMNDRDDWIVHENAHDAIVTRSDWDKVQALLTANKRRTTPVSTANHDFVLTGILKCGACGSSMVGEKVSSGIYYSCSGYRQHGTCLRNGVRQDDILEHVFKAITDAFCSPATVASIRQSLTDQVASKLAREPQKELAKRLRTIDAELEDAKKRLLKVGDDMLDIIQERIRELRTQRETAESELRAVRSPKQAAADAERKVDAALKMLAKLDQALATASNRQLRELVRHTFSRIEADVKAEKPKKRYRYRLVGGRILLSGSLASTDRRFLTCIVRSAVCCSCSCGAGRFGSRRDTD